MSLVSINFIINRPVQFGKGVFVTGNAPELGNWDPSKSLKLFWSEGHNWKQNIVLQALSLPMKLEYKVIVMDHDCMNPSSVCWDSGPNQILILDEELGNTVDVSSYSVEDSGMDNCACGIFEDCDICLREGTCGELDLNHDHFTLKSRKCSAHSNPGHALSLSQISDIKGNEDRANAPRQDCLGVENGFDEFFSEFDNIEKLTYELFEEEIEMVEEFQRTPF